MTPDLSAFGKSTPKAKKAKTTRPVIDDPKLKDGVSAYLAQKAIAKKAEGIMKPIGASLRAVAIDVWLEHNASHPFETSVEVNGNENDRLLVTFSKGYRSGADRDSLVEAVGDEKAVDELFNEKFTLSIDGDSIPVEARNQVISGLAAVFGGAGGEEGDVKAAKKAHPKASAAKARAIAMILASEDGAAEAAVAAMTGAGIDPADAVTAKTMLLPREEFNEVRARRFTIEQNKALDECLKTPTALK